ncbi:hypothetical protein [Pontibacter pamirensis]|nr:hypothetical protein [Pontibacter pamirensis]
MDDVLTPFDSSRKTLMHAKDAQTVALPYLRRKAFAPHNQPG